MIELRDLLLKFFIITYKIKDKSGVGRLVLFLYLKSKTILKNYHWKRDVKIGESTNISFGSS